MIWHHEYLIAFYLGYAEIRHFTYFLGPKFTVFYNVYSRYETQQLATMWADVSEEEQLKHLRHTKEQIEYTRLQNEYDYIKKRALVNYLTNEKLNAEAHFHQRTLNMLRQIQNFESQNLKSHLKKIAVGALDVVNSALKDPTKKGDIQAQAFQAALGGIRSGAMAFD